MISKIKRFNRIIGKIWSLIKLIIDRQPGKDDFRKSLIRVFYEIYQYQKYWKSRYAFDDYLYYDLDRRNIKIDKIKEYIPRVAHNRIQKQTRYIEYECLACDKRFIYLMFRSMNLPHPDVILMMFKGIITDKNFQQLDVAKATSIIMNSGVRRFFLKPAFSHGSWGTDVISLSNGRLYRMNGDETTLRDIVKEAEGLTSGYILQCELQNQHPLMCELNPYSVNTLRIITYRTEEIFKILRILMRIGRKDMLFDNSLAGGVFVNVDPDSFITCGDCFIEKPTVICMGQFHPDTKAKLSGIKLPYADEIKSMLENAAIVFSEHTYLGWDVAITTAGPSLIEVNLGFDIDHHQTVAGRGLRDDLLYNPDLDYQQKSKWPEMNAYLMRLRKLNGTSSNKII